MGGRERVRERGVRGKGEKGEGGRRWKGERGGRERVRSILAQLLPFHAPLSSLSCVHAGAQVAGWRWVLWQGV